MNLKRIVSSIGICSILFISGCGVENKVLSTAKAVNPKMTSVVVNKVVKGDISKKVVYIGKIEPKQKISVVSKIPGVVQEVNFDIGDMVKKGDALFKIDDRDIRNSIEDLQAQIESSEISIQTQEKQIESLKGSQFENQLNQLNQNLKMAQIQCDEAKNNLEDVKKLFKEGIVPQNDLTKSENAYKKAKTSLESAQKAYDLMINSINEENVEKAQKQLEQAKLNKERLEIALKNAQNKLNDTIIKSPIDGVISKKQIEAGEMVGNNSIPFEIVQTDKVYVDAKLSEQYIDEIKKNSSAEIYIDSVSDKAFKGQIKYVSPAADERELTYLVRIEVDNKQNLLNPGMFCEAHFNVENKSNAVLVPTEAVLQEEGKNYVFIAKENSLAQKIVVKTGLQNEKNTEILSGLKGEEIIITKGQNYLKDGGSIKVVEK
ncbi:efflux RND transporter periplasmic adaptor subunit [Clostridium ganghwense]|uniref:Efflux RND transporter periplasmic adaptor subunit n=1 Tax=Clostridium ganghwense TaxID=312089 RepID=A0ABT4CJ20_9CLOT|nr:efflux RND transporter periplasmic adaptor subunit [Clostridium ganghwense]MCY6369053.1 efflux RND transporter periplasmic adaptor subunit [Clostridium ganghwense]